MRNILSLSPPGKGLASQLIATFLWILKVSSVLCTLPGWAGGHGDPPAGEGVRLPPGPGVEEPGRQDQPGPLHHVRGQPGQHRQVAHGQDFPLSLHSGGKIYLFARNFTELVNCVKSGPNFLMV